MNNLYRSLNNSGGRGNNFLQMMASFTQFRNAFRGDPKAEVQKLLDSGKMSQDQYNQLANMANIFMNAMR